MMRNQLRDIPDASALYFTMLSSNERSLTLDTKMPAGEEVSAKVDLGFVMALQVSRFM